MQLLNLPIWAKVHAAGNAAMLARRYLAHNEMPIAAGQPYDPKHSPTVGPQGGAVSYVRGAPVEKI